jgi:acetolactate synthase-1/2/3 large subunit
VSVTDPDLEQEITVEPASGHDAIEVPPTLDVGDVTDAPLADAHAGAEADVSAHTGAEADISAHAGAEAVVEPLPNAADDVALATDAGPTSATHDPESAPATPRAPVRRTVSAEIARQLHAAGARFCFTVPGESFLPLLDDLSGAGIRVITTRHESGAAFMAEALAQSTGRPQIVAVSRAVGASNAAIGIHSASQDSVPLVALVGQVERQHLGREAFQEADIVRSIGSLASWSAQLDDPVQTRTVVAKARRRLANGRPGPIVLSVPRDVLDVEIELQDEVDGPHAGARGPAAERDVVSRVVKLLAASERGVIVAGGGVLRARASKRLVTLSEALAVPVIAAWRRPDVFPNDHVNYLGMTGVWSAPTVRERLADADVIVYIGARLSEANTFGYSLPSPGTRWAQVDLQPHTPAGLDGPSIAVEADASRFLDAAWSDLRAAALDNEMRSRREARLAADREAYRRATAAGQGTWTGPGVHPGRIIETMRRVLPDNATIATDAGNMGGWLVRGYRFRRAGTFLGTTSGAMGFGMPAAIAASLHEPDRIAVAICGDGGFAMSMMEIETAVREGAHPIVIVFDNRLYGTTALEQERHGRSAVTSELGPIDIAGVAQAQGAFGLTVQEDADFEPALREAIAARRISVLHVALDRAWRSVDDHPGARP